VFSVLVSLRKQALTIGTGRNSSCPWSRREIIKAIVLSTLLGWIRDHILDVCSPVGDTGV
jgi:hypothetical protein